MIDSSSISIAVVLPAYRVKKQILDVLSRIDERVSEIYVVDDGCPERCGDYVREMASDDRLVVLTHEHNRGVGAAMITGYQAALKGKAEIIVKLDGDGQMEPEKIEVLVSPLLSGRADYSKGNRFFLSASLKTMPAIRLFGNGVLSFISKAVTGYWNLKDPCNGFTAIHREVLEMLPLEDLEHGYFFEQDVLFQLNEIRAVVEEVQIDALYGSEESSMQVSRIIVRFPLRLLRRFCRRIVRSYFLADFNVGSVGILGGIGLSLFGFLFGALHWWKSIATDVPATSGTVMVAALSVILGFQLLLEAVRYDVNNTPKRPIHARN